jgi:hypothetical protein
MARVPSRSESTLAHDQSSRRPAPAGEDLQVEQVEHTAFAALLSFQGAGRSMVLPTVCAAHPEQLMTVHASPEPTRPGLPVGSVQERQAGLPEPLRALHRRLLAGFLTHGGPPEPAAVADIAVKLGLGPDQALGALAAADLVHRDAASGTIGVAYPFSGRPTLHQVELVGGLIVSAMCALDALGIPPMTRRDARIRATDPVSGQPITVDAHHGA